MKVPNSKLILGAVTVGMIVYFGLVAYEKAKIKEIQAAGPEDQIVPPGPAVMFCVNNKMMLAVGIVAILLGLASYGPSNRGSVAVAPPSEPPAEI
jgi:hypothetical protein